MYDVLVIGGGINGVGIARDATLRGAKVLLCERGDLGSATSSASSKLVHGGLRYLESYEFRLVREALAERETLLGIAPHVIWPMRFVLPVTPGMRPAWLLRLGLFLYDHLARRVRLPPTRSLALRRCPQGASLRAELTRGFEYSDCWADDSRLTVLNAVDAAEYGAEIATRTNCVALERGQSSWTATLSNADAGERTVAARVVVNAAGPWVENVLGQFGARSSSRGVRLIKGSHVVTRRLFDGDHAYIFQAPDGRVIFAIPYEGDYTLIGTTEEEWSHDRGEVAISPAEAAYLCETASAYFARAVTPEDIVWSYAGVRPLFDDKNASASVVTRDYVFDLDDASGAQAPILSIYGGKLTTYRKLAEQAVDRLLPHLPWLQRSDTASRPLPGGDFAGVSVAAFTAALAARYPWLAADTCARLARAYGTRVTTLLGEAAGPDDLGHDFGGGLSEAEVSYLRRHEFARTPEDVLWRRSKLGLHTSAREQASLAQWMHVTGLQLQSAA